MLEVEAERSCEEDELASFLRNPLLEIYAGLVAPIAFGF